MSKFTSNDKNSNTKYTVYENDLKFKHLRKIDPAKANWENDVKDKYYKKDYDTITHRLKECNESDFTYLDLSHLELTKLPDLSGWKYYDKLKHVKYLFLNDNKFDIYDNSFAYLNNLEVLDISNNNLKEITYLQNSLKELVCHNNKLKKIPSHVNLFRIDCSNNNIKNLSQYPNVSDILCYENKMEFIDTYPVVKRIVCRQNPLKCIKPQPTLQYFDCSDTNIEESIEMENLKHLICNNTKINNVDNLKKLEILEMTNCDITKVFYTSSLKDVLFDIKQDVLFSSKYEIQNYYTEHDTMFIKFK
jgi:Leucine-rich repeat (LRR) protein